MTPPLFTFLHLLSLSLSGPFVPTRAWSTLLPPRRAGQSPRSPPRGPLVCGALRRQVAYLRVLVRGARPPAARPRCFPRRPLPARECRPPIDAFWGNTQTHTRMARRAGSQRMPSGSGTAPRTFPPASSRRPSHLPRPPRHPSAPTRPTTRREGRGTREPPPGVAVGHSRASASGDEDRP